MEASRPRSSRGQEPGEREAPAGTLPADEAPAGETPGDGAEGTLDAALEDGEAETPGTAPREGDENPPGVLSGPAEATLPAVPATLPPAGVDG